MATATSTFDLLSDPATLTAAHGLADLRGGPQLAVLDTSCVRTGLAHQLSNGVPPRSLRAVRAGTVKLFMEYSTLVETSQRLPRFAAQLNVPYRQLLEMFNEDWLPWIHVVELPDAVRRVDDRALAVQDLDKDDYPTAALAALLSPCILLTHNTKHFAPLGVREWSQGTTAVAAAINVEMGEARLHGVVIVPAAPVIAVGAGVSWVSEKTGPIAWLIVPLLLGGGYAYYRHQPEEKQQRIRKTAGEVGRTYLEMSSEIAIRLEQARNVLGNCVVPAPDRREPIAAIMRELARSSSSLSAQQICDSVAEDVRPSVSELRAYLHANKGDGRFFYEERHGVFELGRSGYSLH